MINKQLAITIREKDQRLALPEIIKSEVNFLIFPFFALSRRGLKDKLKIEYRDVVKVGDTKEERIWKVAGHQEYGYPGPFDRGVHKAIEAIITEQGLPIQNPLQVGSLYGLCKKTGISNSGWNKRRIKQALKRITATMIDSRSAFYDKGKKQRVTEGGFHLYDAVYFRGETLPDGTEADTVYLFLSPLYLRSLNAFYVANLDYAYLKGLKSKIASRLYELLSVGFYNARRNGQPCVWFDYQALCCALPVTPYRYFSKAQEKLKPAHDELLQSKFLSNVQWQKKSKGEWVIHYYPGPRAKGQLSSGMIQEQLQLKAPQDNKKAEDKIPRSEIAPDQDKLVSALQERGVSQKQAQRLVEEHSQWIKRGIELWELERKKNPERMKNPAGYLVSIIKAGEDWQPPDDYVPVEEQERRKEKRRKAKILKELKEVTEEEIQPSELLSSPKEEISSEELEEEVARIKAEKEKREQDRKAWIEQVLEGLSDQEREEIRQEVLSRIDSFLHSSQTFKELSQQDIRDWHGTGPVVSPVICKRDEIIRERYLDKVE